MKSYSDKYLHVVSIDIPSPPDYGGAMDIYYKLRYFKQIGVRVILHCFEYNRVKDEHLLDFCEHVYYYPKRSMLSSLSFTYPYVVYSRKQSQLLNNLLLIDAPILFEGVHTTYYLNHIKLIDRRKVIRTHNIEAMYFSGLGDRTSNVFKKLIYKREGELMEKVEQNLFSASGFVSVTEADSQYFQNLYPKAKHLVAPCFSDFNDLTSLTPGSGDYILYHGNLNHPENLQVVKYILSEIVDEVNYPIVFAGKLSHNQLDALVASRKNVRIIANPNEKEMKELVTNAHLHLLLTFQATGLKLKLLYALGLGKHIIANTEMLHGTDLHSIVNVCTDKTSIINAINDIMPIAFSEQDVAMRIAFITKTYNQELNALAICAMLFD